MRSTVPCMRVVQGSQSVGDGTPLGTWYARLPQSHLVPMPRLHETSNERNTLSYFEHGQRGSAGGYIKAFHVVTGVRFGDGQRSNFRTERRESIRRVHGSHRDSE